MARNKGKVTTVNNYQIKLAEAIDPRVTVSTKAELFLQNTWPNDGGAPYLYNGLIVGVVNEQAAYMLVNRDNYNSEAGWKRIDGSSPGDVSYEDIYIIEGLTAQDIESFGEGSLSIDGSGLSEAIDSNKRVYIKYSNNAGKAGIIPCSAYKEDVYYVSFRMGSSLYGFDISADSQHIDETSIFHIDIQEKLESGENIKTINGKSILGEGDIKISTSTILDFTVEDVYHAHQEDTDLLGIETKSIVTDIDNKEQIYIYYDEQKQGIIPCGTYRGDEDYYYILFIADNNAFKLHIVDGEETVYIDSIINLEDIKAEIEVDSILSDVSTNPVQNKVITEELNKKANTNAIPKNVSELDNDLGYIKDVDSELSDDSENPVQNKAINAELKKKIEGEIEYVIPVSGMGVVHKDLVLSTPSGDPMHYMFMAAGAEYNATESDIEKTGEYGDTIIHEKGHWYLNEVGDLTNEEMRLIYEDGFHTRKPNGGYPMFFQDLEYRTFLNRTDFQDPVRTTYSFSRCTKALVIRTGKNTTIYQPTGMFDSCERVIKILGVMICASQITDREIGGMFNRCYALQEVKLKNLHRSISLEYSSNISKNSILYMINNAVKSEDKITITLHEDAYNRLIDDKEISNAITTHGNIELSKPESN